MFCRTRATITNFWNFPLELIAGVEQDFRPIDGYKDQDNWEIRRWNINPSLLGVARPWRRRRHGLRSSLCCSGITSRRRLFFFTLPIVCDEKIKFVDLTIWLLTQTSTHIESRCSPQSCDEDDLVFFASPLLGSAISTIVMRIHRCISAYRAHRLSRFFHRPHWFHQKLPVFVFSVNAHALVPGYQRDPFQV